MDDGPLEAGETRGKPRGPVWISTAHAGMADRLAGALRAAGVQVRLAERPGGDCALAILTEGLVAAAPTEVHTGALLAAKAVMALPDSARPAETVFLQASGDPGSAWRGGLPGLSRTLARECPGHRSRTLGLDGGSEPTEAAIQAAAQLVLRGGGPDTVRIGADGGLRQTVMRPLTRLMARAQPQISRHDRILVTGGGQGITAACTIALAARTGAHFILAGRTQPRPWPDGLDRGLGETGLRAALARNAMAAGTRPDPRAIAAETRALLASRSITETLAAIEQAGGTAGYHVLDLAKPALIGEALAAIEAEAGQLTGLIHGAGLLADQRLADMQPAHVERVFQPKVEGLMALLAACPPGRLRHLALFSSAAAHFGNPGQANYAMANAVLNALARALKSAHPALNVKSFGWGPWDGGMVTASLKSAFADRGIETIPIDEGAGLFASLMLAELASAELVIGAI